MSDGSQAPSEQETKRVLVVDDDLDICDILGLHVTEGGFEVVKATRGEEAIAKLSEKPDAIILDLIMPGCGGLGVLKHLKESKGPIPPVIVVTAYENRHPAVIEAMRDPNVVQCLAKPINQKLLIAALQRYLPA